MIAKMTAKTTDKMTAGPTALMTADRTVPGPQIVAE
jgi:hypothetical protein